MKPKVKPTKLQCANQFPKYCEKYTVISSLSCQEKMNTGA